MRNCYEELFHKDVDFFCLGITIINNAIPREHE